MATLEVKYTVTHTEYVHWPDDELDDLNYDNLMCNINHEDAQIHEDVVILNIIKDGEEYEF